MGKQPTYDELVAQVAQLQQELMAARAQIVERAEFAAELEQELAKARARILELEARLKRNSQNSSKPPSADPPDAPPRPKGKKSKRKRGGQPEHQAHFGMVPDHVDQVHEHLAQTCERCNAALSGGEETQGGERHYVYELPELRPIVHEHVCLGVKCRACGWVTVAVLPPGVPPGQYDESVQAMVGVLRGELKQSVRQSSAVMTQVLHVPLSTGMVSKLQKQVSEALGAPYDEAHRYAQAQERVNADETSWRQDKKKAWLWVCVAGLVTVFLIHASRGALAAKALLGAAFPGILSSDRWASYNWVAATQRQLCWSHLKRDFKSFLDYGAAAKGLGEQLLYQSRRMFRLWHRVRDRTLSREEFQLAMKPVRRRIEVLLEEGRALPCAKVSGKCKEILKLREALFTFVDQEHIEPTNNAAERALRFAVLWRKGCFGSDTAGGSRFVERFLTVRATLRSQQRDLYSYLKAACAASLHGTPAPSLLPPLTQIVPAALSAA
jgi:transposase